MLPDENDALLNNVIYLIYKIFILQLLYCFNKIYNQNYYCNLLHFLNNFHSYLSIVFGKPRISVQQK